MKATVNPYQNLNEEVLLTIWNVYFDKHEDGYLENDTKKCVSASIEMDLIADVLFEKFDYTGEDFEQMYQQYNKVK